MIRHFFLDKENTIVKGIHTNFGLNPVLNLTYGNGFTSRGLLHFDETEILDIIKRNAITDFNKLSIKLKMTNCFSVDGYPQSKLLLSDRFKKQRAKSFDIIVFKLPCYFDEGRGFDFEEDFWINNNRSVVNGASNWYFSFNGKVWPVDDEKIDLTDPTLIFTEDSVYKIDNGWRIKINLQGGIYSDEFLNDEYVKFKNGEDSIIYDEQHFDYGNENLSLDITKYVESLINGEHNYGLGIMFSPRFEKMEVTVPQYVGFFTNNTNTFFHPYIELDCCNTISDDRATFYAGKDNDLYLYSTVNGEPTNLDNIPTCTVNDVDMDVEQVSEGVYCAHILASKVNMESGTIGYDNWSNLALNGQKLEDVEMDFEVKALNGFLSVGSSSTNKRTFIPNTSGINDAERLHRGEVREVTVNFRKEFDSTQVELIDSAYYRLYVMDGTREIVVFDYHPIEKSFLDNFFIINTNDLVPNNYFIDIKVNSGRETKYFKKVLRFTVVSDVTERYE